MLAILQSFFSHPEFLVPTLWVTFGCTLAWYLLSAKRFHEIDAQELKLLWESHKQFDHCTANEFEPIRKGKRIVGYVCECGHKHLQERPIINFGA
jgi:hypothetical protein